MSILGCPEEKLTWLEAWLSLEAMDEDLTGDMSGLMLSSLLRRSGD